MRDLSPPTGSEHALTPGPFASDDLTAPDQSCPKQAEAIAMSRFNSANSSHSPGPAATNDPHVIVLENLNAC